jgi:hypothetical protein
MAPKAGQLIRVTAVRPHTATRLSVGMIMIVGEDDHPPSFKDPDGYEWVQSTDHPSDSSASGWVKWEAVKLIAESEYTAIGDALKAAGASEGGRIVDAITRLAGERDDARCKATAYQNDLSLERKYRETAKNELLQRIARLEAEITRLSSPPGTSFGYANGKPVPSQVKEIPLPAIGSWIKITQTSSHALKVGEVIQVGACKREMAPYDQVWVSTGKTIPAKTGERYGWVQWEEWTAPVAAQTPADRSLIGRQRRELRRLNQSQRLMKLELDAAQRINEDMGAHCIDLTRRLRILESAIK